MEWEKCLGGWGASSTCVASDETETVLSSRLSSRLVLGLVRRVSVRVR